MLQLKTSIQDANLYVFTRHAVTDQAHKLLIVRMRDLEFHAGERVGAGGQ